MQACVVAVAMDSSINAQHNILPRPCWMFLQVSELQRIQATHTSLLLYSISPPESAFHLPLLQRHLHRSHCCPVCWSHCQTEKNCPLKHCAYCDTSPLQNSVYLIYTYSATLITRINPCNGKLRHPLILPLFPIHKHILHYPLSNLLSTACLGARDERVV